MKNRLVFMAIILGIIALLGFSCGGDSTGPDNDDNDHGDTVPDLGGTWTLRTSGTGADLKSIAYSGSWFAAVGDSGIVLTSPDGITWSRYYGGAGGTFEMVIWTGTQFIAVGQTPFSQIAVLSFVPAGSSSLKTLGPGKANAISRAQSGRLLVCACQGLLWSNDGVDWQIGDAMEPNGNGQPCLYKIWDTPLGVFASGTWTAYSFPYWFKMSNGDDYFDSSSADIPRGGALVWTGTQLHTSEGYRTSDGITWTVPTSADSISSSVMIWTGSLIVAAANNGYIGWKSDNGSWTKFNVGVSNHLQGIAFSGTRYVVVGRGGVILTRP